MRLPNTWLGQWEDEKGTRIDIQEVSEHTYSISVRDIQGDAYRIELLDGTTKDSLMCLADMIHDHGYALRIECGTHGLGPVYILKFMKRTEDGTILWATEQTPLHEIYVQPDVEMGLYDDWEDDKGVPWAYPASFFSKISMNTPDEDKKKTFLTLSPSERLRYVFSQMKQKNAQIRHPRNVKVLILRCLAFFVDVVVMFLPMIFIAIPLASWRESLALLGVIPSFLFMPLYFVLKDGMGGAGVGKRLCGLRVVDADTHRPIGYSRSWDRFIGPVLLLLVLEPFILWYLGDRRFGDIATNTRVVQKKDMVR